MAYAEKYVLNHPSILKLILSHLLGLIKSPKNIYFQQSLMAWIVLRSDGEVLVAGDMVVGVVMGDAMVHGDMVVGKIDFKKIYFNMQEVFMLFFLYIPSNEYSNPYI